VSAITILGQLGLAALVAAVVTAYMATRRERLNARRAWLGEALAAFYAPVSAKLELDHRWHIALRQQREERTETIFMDDPRAVVERKLVAASVRLQGEITEIIENNLHYVDRPEVRSAAIDYLKDSYFATWHRDATDSDKALAEGRSIILLSSEEPARDGFHVLVAEEFEAKGAEFRRLSTGTSPRKSRRTA
jgi:hypothetical protein